MGEDKKVEELDDVEGQAAEAEATDAVEEMEDDVEGHPNRRP